MFPTNTSAAGQPKARLEAQILGDFSTVNSYPDETRVNKFYTRVLRKETRENKRCAFFRM
jgi:hypothetical protein